MACGSSGGGGSKIAVTLNEWSVRPSVAQVKPGKVTFDVSNIGARPHEFVLVKSDLPPDQLPVADGRVNESQLNVPQRLDTLAPGASRQLTFDISPGKYVIICNLSERPPGQAIVSHYQNGMYASFLVEPQAGSESQGG